MCKLDLPPQFSESPGFAFRLFIAKIVVFFFQYLLKNFAREILRFCGILSVKNQPLFFDKFDVCVFSMVPGRHVEIDLFVARVVPRQ